MAADSNVRVLPEDDGSTTSGVRAELGLDVGDTLLRGTFNLDVDLSTQFGRHVSGRDELSLFDTEAFDLNIGASVPVGDADAYFAAFGNETFIDSFDGHFMQEAGAYFELRGPEEEFVTGFFAEGALRDFDDLNDEGGENDRDGARAAAGPRRS